MVGGRGRGHGRGHCEEPLPRDRDVRDIEIDDLRRQVQQLTKRLEHCESQNRDDFSLDFADGVNPFHRGPPRDEPDDGVRTSRMARYQARVRDVDLKVDIPVFEGPLHALTKPLQSMVKQDLTLVLSAENTALQTNLDWVGDLGGFNCRPTSKMDQDSCHFNNAAALTSFNPSKPFEISLVLQMKLGHDNCKFPSRPR
ncbi:hypothetical protein HHK36_023301 [Tetracentron sinense]|uniref:Uncharacterized protein n=1 Tax=Tetracentron sinense TaxID=13715 RepID=A0A834YQ56_TETSI|nr:hypothetical protein HHK36_023301 [Tetracentron sinense]